MSKTFALANEAGEVKIWARPLGDAGDGGIRFDCINGAWTGVFYPERGVCIVDHECKEEQHEIPMRKVWEGEVPASVTSAHYLRDRYNDAMNWIKGQIA